jgi:hypothetical protein
MPRDNSRASMTSPGPRNQLAAAVHDRWRQQHLENPSQQAVWNTRHRSIRASVRLPDTTEDQGSSLSQPPHKASPKFTRFGKAATRKQRPAGGAQGSRWTSGRTARRLKRQ